MSKQKLTQWFPADVKPVHVGVYEVLYQNGKYGKRYRYWDGKKFCYQSFDSQHAFDKRYSSTRLPKYVEWRGLSEQPK